MKLKTEFMIQKIDDTQFLVPVGAEAFHGIVRGNEPAGAIVELLRKETTEEKTPMPCARPMTRSGRKSPQASGAFSIR